MSVTVSPKRLRREFVKKVKELSGQNLQLCYQCGMCTGNCPATVNCPRGFDLSKVMEAIRLVTLRKNIDHIRPEDIAPQERCELPQIAMVSGLRKFTG